jgi:hypothetical protein
MTWTQFLLVILMESETETKGGSIIKEWLSGNMEKTSAIFNINST